MTQHFMLVMLGVIQCLVLTACGEDGSVDQPEPQGVCQPARASILPALTGPYCVGERLMPLMDPSREEPFTSDPDDRREVMVHLFYPIDQGIEGEPAPYTDQATFDWLLTVAPPGNYEHFPTNSLLDAPLASGRRTFPLLLLSPGIGVVTQLQTAMSENLASHGYIVAAINHPYVSAITAFPDGHAVLEDPALVNLDLDVLKARFPVLVADQQFVLDHLQSMAPDDTMWRGRIDFDRVGSLGHSLGGATAAEVCVKDPRVRACIDYDGIAAWVFGDILERGSDKPLLLVLSEGPGFPNPQDVLSRLTGPFYTAQVSGALHLGFATDIGIVNGHFAPTFPNEILVGTMAPLRLVEITNAYNLAFFGVYLRDEPATVLTELAGRFPEVLVASSSTRAANE